MLTVITFTHTFLMSLLVSLLSAVLSIPFALLFLLTDIRTLKTTAASIFFYRFGRSYRPVVICFVLFCFFCVGFYQEFLVFFVQSRSWLRLEPIEKDSKYLKLLIVADPQLIGYRNDLPGILGSIARYDSDNYLARGYAQVIRHHNPDMIVFLGDLFDEGNSATDEEFAATAKRFRQIFPVPGRSLSLYLSGDNDVGGEGTDRFSDSSQRRFDLYFDTAKSQMNYISFQFLKITQANVMSGEYRQVGMVSPNVTDFLSILITHIPLLDTFDYGSERILHKVRPHLVLSGHDHKARILSRRNILERSALSMTSIKPAVDFVFSKTYFNKTTVPKEDAIFRNADFGYPAYELISPTCSYRMGVRHMGYGALIIEQFKDKSISVRFTIFWTPDRYWQLYFYVAIICFSAICAVLSIWVTCCRRILRCCTSTRSSYQRLYDRF